MSAPGPVERAAILLMLARRFAEAQDLGVDCVVVCLTRKEIMAGLTCLDDELDPTGDTRAIFRQALMRLTADLN